MLTHYAKIFIMFKHSSLLDRSRNILGQLATIRRMHRIKASVNHHLDDLEDVMEEFGQLPLCLRDEYLTGAVNRAIDNSCAINDRVNGWTFEEEEVVEGDVVKDLEEYRRRCIAVVEDLREGIRALRALVDEEEKDDEQAVEQEEDREEEQGEVDDDE